MRARTRVAAAVLAFAALPMILVNWTSLRQRQVDAARTSDLVLTGNAGELAGLLASTRTRWLESVRADARLPGVDEMLVREPPPDPQRVDRFFGAVGSRDMVNINAIGLVDLEGRVVYDSRAINLGRDESGAAWFQRAVASGQPQIVGPLVAEGENAPGLYIAALVRDANETRRGLLRVRMEPAALGQVLHAALMSSPGLSASLHDDNGRRIAGSGPLASRPLALPARGELGRDAGMTQNGERIAVADVPQSPWRVVVRQEHDAWAEPQARLRSEWLLQTTLLLVFLLGASMWLGWRIARPLARFSRVARRMAQGDFSPVPSQPGADETQQLSAALDGLATRLRDTIGSLSHELEQRLEVEAALSASREQYLELVEQLPAVVYRGANRPGWPMVYLSPQIEGLTGYTPDAILAGEGIDFAHLVHRDDRNAREAAITAAIQKRDGFEVRYRIRHRDGDLRWVWEIGSVHADAGGRPDRVTGVLFDATESETTHQAMDLLRGRLDAQVGGDYFAALASGLARLLDAESVLIARFVGQPPDRLASLALADRQGHNEHVEASLAGTAAATLLTEGRVECGDGAMQRFPDDQDLALRGIRAYIGRRLDAGDGRPLGVLAVLDAKPMRTDAAAALVLDLVQARAAAELERVMADEDLKRLADSLENRVVERTAELEATNVTLSQAMDQLVQQEKLASLGNLVAGIAHELNTPIGNALTVSTTLLESHRRFAAELAAGQLKRSTLERFVGENDEAAQLIERNLQRAATLITHFKQVAVDQASVRRRRFDLAELVDEVLSTLSPRLKRSPHRIEVAVPTGLQLESYPGPLEQVVTNLIENSLMHAFAPGEAGVLRIDAERRGDEVQLRYQDSGRGIPADLRRRVFDPFFTTRLGQGGSGLGLYLVYNLVNGRLGGSIRLVEGEGRGACFVLDLPTQAPAYPEDPLA